MDNFSSPFDSYDNYDLRNDALSEVDVNRSPFRNGSTVSIIIEFARKSVQVKLHMN